jgi:hypothetical protein
MDEIGPELTAGLSQRQKEVLAAYAQSPPGETAKRFLRRVRLAKQSWHIWRTQPTFAAAFAAVQAARAQIDLGPFHERLGAVTARVLDDALNAPTARDRHAACRTVLEAVGALKGASVRVSTSIENHAAVAVPPREERDLNEMVREADKLAEMLWWDSPLEYVERVHARISAVVEAKRERANQAIASPVARNVTAE